MADELYWRDERVPVAPAVDWSVLGEFMPDGIYFGMDEQTYHAAPALSNTGIKNLGTSTMDFWARSWMNPEYDGEETEAKDLGKAYDCRIMDGRSRFYARYAQALDAADYPSALRTSDEMKAMLADAGVKVMSKWKKPDLVAEVLKVDPSAEIWETLVSEHAQANAGKELLSFDTIKRIELAAAMIENHPELKKAFTGGYPQVSIFWRDEGGVPMKARLDYLKYAAIVDFKTFSNPFRKPVDKAVAYAIASYKYHIQVAVYVEAVEYAKRFAKEGKVYGEPEPSWLKQFSEAEEHTFMFVFQQTGIAPVVRGYVFPRHLVYDCGKIEVRDAKMMFAGCTARYGTDPWVDLSSIRSFDDTEFPAWMTM